MKKLHNLFFATMFLFSITATLVAGDSSITDNSTALSQMIRQKYEAYHQAAECYKKSVANHELTKEQRDKLLQDYFQARQQYNHILTHTQPSETSVQEPEHNDFLPNKFDPEGKLIDQEAVLAESSQVSHAVLFEHYDLQSLENRREGEAILKQLRQAKIRLLESTRSLAATPWLNLGGKIITGVKKLRAVLKLRKAKKRARDFATRMASIKRAGLDHKKRGELTADDVHNYIGLSSGFEGLINSLYGEHYEQSVYNNNDPIGDAHLIRKLDQVPMKLLKAIAKIEDYPQNEIQDDIEENEAEFQIGKEKPILIKKLKDQIAFDIKSLQPVIQPKKGEEPNWSPQAKKYSRLGFFKRFGRFITGKQKDLPTPLFMRSKLFLSLACGYTNRYMKTGFEESLKETILQNYADKSVKPHDLFMEAYKLADGDIFKAILTCENMLAGNPYRENRQDDPVQKKLVYLRNDSKQLGDNYGAWYHFFGIALYGYARKAPTSRVVAEVESLGSIVLEGFDTQEDQINREGAKFGYELQKMVNNQEWKRDNLTPQAYMNINEFR